MPKIFNLFHNAPPLPMTAETFVIMILFIAVMITLITVLWTAMTLDRIEKHLENQSRGVAAIYSRIKAASLPVERASSPLSAPPRPAAGRLGGMFVDMSKQETWLFRKNNVPS